MSLTYTKIKDIVKTNNSVVLYDVAIAGDAIKGLFSMITVLTFLHKNIENDTYHPFLFRHLFGVSIGSVILNLCINTCYLYENFGKRTSLEYLDAIYSFIGFKNIRNVLFDIGLTQELNPYNSYKLIDNFMRNGALFCRDSLRELLIGDHPSFGFKNVSSYFATKKYYKWLKPHLKNCFIVTYSCDSSIASIFTGNLNRYKEHNTNYYRYEKLTPDNFFHAVMCSSSIPILYPIQQIGGANYCTDGASIQMNLANVQQSVIQNIQLYDQKKVYGDLLNFFGITQTANNNFLIITNKINIQGCFEKIEQYNNSSIKPVQSIITAFGLVKRIYQNSVYNSSLLSVYLNQPFIEELSSNNMNTFMGEAYHTKQYLVNSSRNKSLLKRIENMHVNIPSIEMTPTEFEISNQRNIYHDYDEYNNLHKKYRGLIDNQPFSVYVNNFSHHEINSVDIHVLVTDLFIREMYNFSNYIYIDFFCGNKSEEVKDFIFINKKVGVLMGNVMYNNFLKQSTVRYQPENLQLNMDVSHIVSNAISGLVGDI